MKKVITIGLVVLVSGLIAFQLYSNKQIINEKNKPVDRSAIAIPVKVVRVNSEHSDGKFSLPAVLQPIQEADLTISVSGKLKNLSFDLGSKVRKGQLLGFIDMDQKQINLKNAELQVEKLKSDYERTKELRQGNAASQVELDNAKYNYENAKFQVESLKQQISDGSLVSPISGEIVTKDAEVGEFISTGKAVAHIVDVTSLKTIVKVSERDVYRLQNGFKVKVFSEVLPGKELDGRITFISPKGDSNHNYDVEIRLNDLLKSELKAGTFVVVEFNLNTDESIIQIPKKALIEGLSNPQVFVASGDKVIKRKLILGRDLGDNIEVVKGVAEGELVVVSGQINLTEKSIIKQIK